MRSQCGRSSQTPTTASNTPGRISFTIPTCLMELLIQSDMTMDSLLNGCVVYRPTRWSLLLLIESFCRSSSWWWQPHIRGVDCSTHLPKLEWGFWSIFWQNPTKTFCNNKKLSQIGSFWLHLQSTPPHINWGSHPVLYFTTLISEKYSTAMC